MMVAGGFPIIVLILSTALGACLSIPLGHLQPYQQSRILTFINPSIDPQGPAIRAASHDAVEYQLSKRAGMGTQSICDFCLNFIQTLYLPAHRRTWIYRGTGHIWSLRDVFMEDVIAIYQRISGTNVWIFVYHRVFYYGAFTNSHKYRNEHGNYPGHGYYVAICFLWWELAFRYFVGVWHSFGNPQAGRKR